MQQKTMMLTFEIGLLIVPFLLHLFGIFILCRTAANNLGFTCKLFFVNLSLAEVTVCLFGILKRCAGINKKDNLKFHATLLQYAIGYSLYYLVMIILTMDRFFRVYLNLKFHLYWPDWWNGKILIGCWIFSCALFATSEICKVPINQLNKWFFPVYDVVFIVISIITYTYIFVRVKGNRKKLHKPQPSSAAEDEQGNDDDSTTLSMASNSTDKNDNIQAEKRDILSNSKEFLSIFLLVITFQIFTVLPDFIYVYIELKYPGTDMSHGLSVIVLFMYGMGYTVDFFIYTFSSKAVRHTLFKMFQNG